MKPITVAAPYAVDPGPIVLLRQAPVTLLTNTLSQGTARSPGSTAVGPGRNSTEKMAKMNEELFGDFVNFS